MQHQLSPLKHFSGCESIHFWMETSFRFSTKRLHFAACQFSFTLRWNNHVWIKLRGDAFCSAKQHRVIMPSWLPKVPSWLRRNTLCLSQSAFSNFAPYVIMEINCSLLEKSLRDASFILCYFIQVLLSNSAVVFLMQANISRPCLCSLHQS